MTGGQREAGAETKELRALKAIHEIEITNLKRRLKEQREKRIELEQQIERLTADTRKLHTPLNQPVGVLQAQTQRHAQLCLILEANQTAVQQHDQQLDEARLRYAEIEKLVKNECTRECKDNSLICACPGVLNKLQALHGLAKSSLDLAGSIDLATALRNSLRALQQDLSAKLPESSNETSAPPASCDKQTTPAHALETKLQLEELHDEIEEAQLWKTKYYDSIRASKLRSPERLSRC